MNSTQSSAPSYDGPIRPTRDVGRYEATSTLNTIGCRSRSDVEKREQFRSVARSGLKYGAAKRQISGSYTDLHRKEPRDNQYRHL